MGQVYNLDVVATDNGTPPQSDSQVVTINVLNRLQATGVVYLSSPDPGPMQVAVDFNEAMQPAEAQAVANYKIVSQGGISLPIQSARYADTGSQHRVVLTVEPGTNVVPDVYHVSIDAGRLTATNGDQGCAEDRSTLGRRHLGEHAEADHGQPDGSFAVSGTSAVPRLRPPRQIVAGNFAGNGNTDLVMITSGKHEETINGNDTFVFDPVLLLKSNGDGTYAPPVPIALGGEYQAVSLDGRLEPRRLPGPGRWRCEQLRRICSPSDRTVLRAA